MLAWSRFSNTAAGPADLKQQQMMLVNGATYGSTMPLAAYGDAANLGLFVSGKNGVPPRSPSPSSASATSPNTAAAGRLGVPYPGSYAVPWPAVGYHYPPYTAAKQYVSQQPESAEVMPRHAPSPESQATTSSTAALAPATQQNSTTTSPSSGTQSPSFSASPPGKVRDSPRSGRHRRRDSGATATPASAAQPPSPSRHNGGGIHSEGRHYLDLPPPNGTDNTHAPPQMATTAFGEVLPHQSNGYHSHIAPAAPTAAWCTAHGDDGGDGGGRRRRRRRHGDDSSARRRTALPGSSLGRKAHKRAKGPRRRRHRHRDEVRGQHENRSSDMNGVESVSARVPDASHHPQSNHESGECWDSFPSNTATNAPTSTGAASPSMGPVPATTLDTPCLQPVTVGSTLMLLPPPPPAIVPAAPPLHSGVPSPPISSATPPPPAVQPTSASKRRRRHRSHRRTPSASSSSSDGRSDAAPRQRSSSYSSFVSSPSKSASGPAPALPRGHHRRRRRDCRGRRGRRRSPHLASSSRLPPTSRDPVGIAPSPPTNNNASVPEVSKKKGKCGIWRFFRRNKSATPGADLSTAGKVGVPSQEMIRMMLLSMPQRAVYDTSTGPCSAAVQPQDSVAGVQQYNASSPTDGVGPRRHDCTMGRSQYPAPSSGIVSGHIALQQGNGNRNPSADPTAAAAPSKRSKGLLGSLFRKKKKKADGGATAVADGSANSASAVNGGVFPASRPSTTGISGNSPMKAAVPVGFSTQPKSTKPPLPGGRYEAAPMNVSTAPNSIFIPMPDVFVNSTKKSKIAAAQLHQRPPQPNGLESQLQAQKHTQSQHTRGSKGHHRSESRGQI